MAKKKLKRRWYTVAYFTREGVPHPSPPEYNFVRKYQDEKRLLEDLSSIMSRWSRGAYAAAAWVGELDEWECLHGDQRPKFYVYEGGRVERL